MDITARARCALLFTLAPIATACGGGGALRLSDVTPEAIPALEAARAERPADEATRTRLGVGYFRASRLDEARQVLDSAVAADPRNGIAAIYLGMTTESQGDFPAARVAYGRYLEVGRSGELRSAARQRLALVGRRELEYQARQALAQEAQLAGAEPEPNTIAVMPFAYSGTNEEIRPLTRGLAQLMVTDLAKSRQVRVLERERMQALLDELRLAEEGRADPTTAARSGRLLRAQRVVQGSLLDREQALRADAAVVDVTTTGVAATATASDRLEALFDIEKMLVLDIFRGLGIQLTDAERAAIEQRPTQNLQAFLAWSRGLEAEDRGDFGAARSFYEEAQRIDPSFLSASQSAGEVADLQTASEQSVQDVDVAVNQNVSTETGGVTEDLRRDALASASNNITPTSVAQLSSEIELQPSVPPRERDLTSEGTGTEGVRPVLGTIIIVIRRP
jgi:TolB-like protein